MVFKKHLLNDTDQIILLHCVPVWIYSNKLHYYVWLQCTYKNKENKF